MRVIAARVVCDSMGASGVRLTTMLLTYPRFVHAQLMTHRIFSRNAASSRAIPTSKIIEAVTTNPAMPVHWGANQKGMVAGAELDGDAKAEAIMAWKEGRSYAASLSSRLHRLGVHKEIANRPMEPWMHMTTLVTSTSFDNWTGLRTAHDAQGETGHLAVAMHTLMAASVPDIIGPGQWHLPFLKEGESEDLSYEDQALVSSARCARVSYANESGYMDEGKPITEELERGKLLMHNKHWSPTEHPARSITTEDWNISIALKLERAMDVGRPFDAMEIGNFCGWEQFRKMQNLTMESGVRR